VANICSSKNNAQKTEDNLRNCQFKFICYLEGKFDYLEGKKMSLSSFQNLVLINFCYRNTKTYPFLN